MIKLRAAALVVRRSITMSPTLAPHSTTGEAADGGDLARLPGVFPHKATDVGGYGPSAGCLSAQGHGCWWVWPVCRASLRTRPRMAARAAPSPACLSAQSGHDGAEESVRRVSCRVTPASTTTRAMPPRIQIQMEIPVAEASSELRASMAAGVAGLPSLASSAVKPKVPESG